MADFIDPYDEKPRAAPSKFVDPNGPRTAADMSTREMIGQSLVNFFRGGLAGVAIPETSKLIDKATYNVGGYVTDKLSGDPLQGRPGVLSPERAAQAGFATNVLGQYLPTLATGGVLTSAARPLMQDSARFLMQNAVKPPMQAGMLGKTEPGVETMLQRGIDPNMGGLQKLDDLIAPFGQEVDRLIARATSLGQTVDRNAIAAAMRTTLPRFEGLPQRELDAIARAEAEFLASQPRQIPVADAQRLKENWSRYLRENAFGQIGSGETEAYKALRAGARQELERVVPGVAAPNAAQSELLNARNLVERRAVMGPNAALLGMAPMAHSAPGFWTAILNSSDLAKSKLARALYSGSSVVPNAVGQTIGAATMIPFGQAPDSQFMANHPYRGALSAPLPSNPFLRGILSE